MVVYTHIMQMQIQKYVYQELRATSILLKHAQVYNYEVYTLSTALRIHQSNLQGMQLHKLHKRT
jgi:hypothetical protein